MYNPLPWLYSEVTIPGGYIGLTTWGLLRMRVTRDQIKPGREVTLKVIQRVTDS